LYFYFFVWYTSTLTIQANIDNYNVELYNKKIAQSSDYNCEESNCFLEEISPFSYNLRVRKDGYKTVYRDIKINPRENLKIDIEAIKEISLTEKLEDISVLSNKDKISYLRDKKKAYKFFDFEDGEYAYFSEEWWLYVYKHSKAQKVGDFSFSASDILDVKHVDQTQYLFFQIWDLRYLYDLEGWTITTLDFSVDIHYIKSHKDKLVFITPVWAYRYDISWNSFDYFYLFKDFIFLEDMYIWVIYSDEVDKLKNFDLEETNSNLIIKYNPESKKREILYKTNLDIEKIYIQDDSIYFEAEGKRYELENL